VIAVVVVATALCADRAAVAASAHARPGAKTQSRSLASRIATGFKQTVAPATPMLSVRTSERATWFPLPIREAASGVRAEFSPFQFRLPPPTR
jgi:hypothetical protein